MQKCSADCWWCVYVWPWKVWNWNCRTCEENTAWECVRLCWYSCENPACVHEIPIDLFQPTMAWFCMLCRVTLWPHRCLPQRVHPPLQSLRSPLKLLLPKGAVCVKTHISPQQMVVSLAILSYQPDWLPGLGLLHSQPSRLLASHHPADKILFMD